MTERSDLQSELSAPNLSVHSPDGVTLQQALARATHIGVMAHQDDLEFSAFHGIARCYSNEQSWFLGIICTDGAGSVRPPHLANLTGDELSAVRYEEQNRAADIGRYSAVIQLGYPSKALASDATRLVRDLKVLLKIATGCKYFYLHAPTDKHGTHLRVCEASISALRELCSSSGLAAGAQVYGCEGWRGLDWVPDKLKIALDVGDHLELAKMLAECFQSQISAGKNYSEAVLGRWQANATFSNPRQSDVSAAVIYALDLLALVTGAQPLSLSQYVAGILDQFRTELLGAL